MSPQSTSSDGPSDVFKVVHGLSVPIGKLGYHLPRTLSNAVGSNSVSMDPEEPQPPFHLRERVTDMRRDKDRRTAEEPSRPVFRIGGSVIRTTKSETAPSGAASPVLKAKPGVLPASGADSPLEREPKAETDRP